MKRDWGGPGGELELSPKLKGSKNILASLFCTIPVFIGFVLPNIQLAYWALNYKLEFFNEKFITTAWNTFYLAIVTAVICAVLAVVINFSIRYKKNKLLNILSSFLTVGYAVPGLILALGVSQSLFENIPSKNPDSKNFFTVNTDDDSPHGLVEFYKKERIIIPIDQFNFGYRPTTNNTNIEIRKLR